MLAAAHRPLLATHVLSELMRAAEAQGAIGAIARKALEDDISTLSQALGACEKILRCGRVQRRCALGQAACWHALHF